MIAYASRAAKKQPQLHKDIIDIVKTAKQMNPKFAITGVLFYDQGLFLQVIEGHKAHLNQLIQNIQNDQRHSQVDILLDEPIERRGFSDWNMDFFDLSNGRTIEKDKLVRLAEDFQMNLIPRGDAFVRFYKTILERSNL